MICRALLSHGRAGRVTAQNGGLRPRGAVSDQAWMLEPSHLASLSDGARAFFQTFIDQYGAQIKDGEPDVPGAEEWRRHVRPHGVTGRRYMPQFIQMAGTMMRLGVEAGVVGELARL